MTMYQAIKATHTFRMSKQSPKFTYVCPCLSQSDKVNLRTNEREEEEELLPDVPLNSGC